MEWNEDMNAAPKDGTPIEITNTVMEDSGTPPVTVHWGDIFVSWRDKPYRGWVTQWGQMACPDKWRPQPPE